MHRRDRAGGASNSTARGRSYRALYTMRPCGDTSGYRPVGRVGARRSPAARTIRRRIAMPTKKSITGSELFIVDNSDEDWKVLRYLHDWCQISSALDVATGYFEIGSLLALGQEWQKVDRIRILMGDEVTKKTKAAFTQALANDPIQAEFWRILGGGSKEVKRLVRPCDYAGQVRFKDTGRKAPVGSLNTPDS